MFRMLRRLVFGPEHIALNQFGAASRRVGVFLTDGRKRQAQVMNPAERESGQWSREREERFIQAVGDLANECGLKLDWPA
jgi:hypothetical protein